MRCEQRVLPLIFQDQSIPYSMHMFYSVMVLIFRHPNVPGVSQRQGHLKSSASALGWRWNQE